MAVAPTLIQAPPPARKVALKSAQEQPAKESAEVVEPAATAGEYSPHDILTSFAKKGVVCALYQPKRDASVGANSDAYQLCSAADIVIVDWDLYGDAGKKALELVSNLLTQSLTDVPEQLRLVLFYTLEANLEAIANEVYESLIKTLPNDVEPTQEDKGLALHTPNTRVVILGKPAVRPAKYQAYETKEKDLAERAINEFAKLASGLLQGAILIGLAEIRSNHRKVLSRFDASLDPAFLTHRALGLPEEEASEHVLPLLVAEIEAALEDQLPHPLLPDALIEDWCATKWTPQSHSKTAAGTADPRKLAKELCTKGKASVKSVGLKDDKLYSFLQEATTSKANHRFALLMSQRTHYGRVPRTLRLGTIVKDCKGGYYLCLQPVCDAVRIKESRRRFLMVELHPCAGEVAKGKFNLVVADKGAIIELFFEPKVFYCAVFAFASGSKDGAITAEDGQNQTFHYTCADDQSQFEWIAQLKPSQAQRAAESFGKDLSRVGLTESEWLRLMVRK